MRANFIVKHGESLTLMLDKVEGDISVVSTVVAKMKRAGLRGTIPPISEPVIYTLATTSYANGWYLTLTGAEISALPIGYYIVDATLTLSDGEVDKTEAVLIEVQRSVS